MEVKIQKIEDVNLPHYANEHDAGLDIYSAEDLILKKGEKRVVKSGVKMAIPEGFVGLIWDKSGLAAKKGIHVMAGVIDSGYRGEIGVVLKNLGEEDFHVEKNMKIAQMLIQPIITAKIIESDSLEDSERGEGGFGSSGLK
ncbi:deoxyuridine 5'-triphosphate nucleotidohydrolase [Candidatus Woesearchaeota archaeon B3_Woes]|nr:MAG: deoxyuridine 5'-triphosphate nucleotidohydrolase [Candidatus Woesearchaeota archaeon B3_Woes]